MQYAIVNVSAAPVRKKPDHRTEMVNQLLFGETVQILKKKGWLWLKVRSLHDGYEGWMTNTLLEETDELTANLRQPFILSDLTGTAIQEQENKLLTCGATFAGFKDGKAIAGGKEFVITGKVVNRFEVTKAGDVVGELIRPWLNVPYLWGGRTPLGIDCSGFTQVIFKQLGIDLPRDAWQQAEVGEPVTDYMQARCGDLVFFGKKGRITHVGILLENNEMVHSSGKVRIDRLGSDGREQIKTGGGKLRACIFRRVL